VVGLEDESGEGFLAWLREIKVKIGIPADLGAAGVDRSQLDRLSRLAFEDTCHLNNPRPVQQDDFRRIYAEAFS
jgi:alcohol dehydrogenase class IV